MCHTWTNLKGEALLVTLINFSCCPFSIYEIGWMWKDKKKIKNREHEQERKNEKLIKDLREDVEKACSMYEELQEESAHVEVEYELLVDELKDELCRIRHESQVECYLDVDEIRYEIDKEFVEDIREVHVKKKM